MSSAVTCENLKHDFDTESGPLRVLKGVNLEIHPGELTMLVGPSGCGKTTLISIFAGLLRHTEGSVSVLGNTIEKMTQHDLLQLRLRQIGFIFQQYNLLAGLPACENAAVPLVAAGWSWRRAIPVATDMLAKLGLAEHVHKLPRQLSGGQQQRVAIARALVHQPDLLLCDEPTAALDSASGQTVLRLLRELAVHPQRAAVIVTHDPRIYSFADRIIHMEDGSVSRSEAVTADAAPILAAGALT